jgi:hypothetical protein
MQDSEGLTLDSAVSGHVIPVYDCNDELIRTILS